MNNLIKQIKALEKSSVKAKVRKRLKEFKSFKNKNTKEWFSELCFCLLTANSKARTAIQIQDQLGFKGFYRGSRTKIKNCIRGNGHRFHNNKTSFIMGARKHVDIKEKINKITNEIEAREWLVNNIKGLGYKEASHFLRNVGFKNLSILDRHILNLMLENGFIKEKPKTLTKNKYLEIENKFKEITNNLGMSVAELDLYMWYIKGGEVLK